MKISDKTRLTLLQIGLAGLIAIGGSYWEYKTVHAQTDKSVAATKPVEVQFSASDAVEINKYRLILMDANAHINEILGNYGGGDGEFIVDKKNNWIGVRRVEAKKP